jgi:hypothetical protein
MTNTKEEFLNKMMNKMVVNGIARDEQAEDITELSEPAYEIGFESDTIMFTPEY